ncbi:hypothetical protein [Spirosoma flavum]|uniref:Class IIb bacteriocin, lactobin A/cerein 7B family n=1 Tax=Spirosoma flavum TaxID=2048557 RepID=A0ABW6AK65_9BACT
MTNFNFDQAEVVELQNAEMTEVDGGGIIGLLFTVAGIICNYYNV